MKTTCRLLLTLFSLSVWLTSEAQIAIQYVDLRTTESENLKKKVKSVSSVGYQLEKGEKGEVIRKEELEFDKQCRLTSHTEEASRFGKKSLKKTVYLYDNDGNLLNESMFRDGEKRTELRCVYDEKGKILTIEDYRSGELDTKVSYEYNENAQLVLESNAYGSGEVYQKFKYSYDNKGNCTSRDVLDPSSGEVLETKTYTLDEKGNVLEEATTSHGSMVEKTGYTYHSNGQIERKIVYDTGSGYPVSESVYDENGNQTQTIRYDHEGSVTRKRIKLYDVRGNMISNSEVDGNGEPVGKSTTMTYEYDKKGNWILQKVSIDGELMYQMDRTILY